VSIPDGEIIMRRFGKGKKPRPGALKLREDETGASCNLKSQCEPCQMLVIANRPDDWVAGVTAQQIRSLGLDVVVVDEPGNPGHCEIRSATASLSDEVVLANLADLFKSQAPLYIP
jgi:hypothetical protein